MIKIGICDDEEIMLELLRKIVEECLKKLKFENEVFLFHDAEELLCTEQQLDILFLDLEMPQVDGIEAGKKLREQGNTCRIIVATSRVERYKEAFYIDTFRFVTKPYDKNEIEKTLVDAVYSLGGIGIIEVYKEREKYNIQQRDILFMAAVDSSVEFVLEKGIFRKETSLTKQEKILDKTVFCRISRSYIVNMAKIEKYEKGTIFIKEEKLKVSQRRKRDFEIKYREYMV